MYDNPVLDALFKAADESGGAQPDAGQPDAGQPDAGQPDAGGQFEPRDDFRRLSERVHGEGYDQGDQGGQGGQGGQGDGQGGQGDGQGGQGDGQGDGQGGQGDGQGGQGGQGGDQGKVGLKKKREVEPLPEFDEPRRQQEPSLKVPEGLNDDDRERAELAIFAEQHLGEDYKGLGERVTNFLSSHQKFVEDALAEDPDTVFDETNDEYQKFLRANDPKIPPNTWKKIEKAQWKWEARQEFEGEKRELEQKMERQSLEPQIEQRIEEFNESLLDTLPEDQKKFVQEHGMEKFLEDHPFEGELVNDVLSKNYSLASEMLRINAGLSPFDPENSAHNYLASYIEQQGRKFYEQGGQYREKDGKQFLPASAYQKAIQAGESDKYWTFASTDVLAMLKEESRREIKTRLDKELARLERAGFSRDRGASTHKPTSGDARPPRAPRPTPRGDAEASPPQQNSVLKILGY